MPDNEDALMRAPSDKYTFEQMNMLIRNQRLWTQFAMWMRNFALGTLDDSRNLADTTNRLFEALPLDFFNMFRVFYGDEIAQQFLNIFSKFISSTWPLLQAFRNNDQAALDSSTVQWYQTADELAVFLARNNIYWNEDQWRSLLYQYIRAYIQGVIAYQNGEYGQEISIYDTIENISNRMGGYMARGIIARNLATSLTCTEFPTEGYYG
ncbi:MAG TPA: hypothetical protein PKA19_03125 [Bacillota bacterium]|nr:hypothetical protein [Bacillota bacterium]